MSPNHRAVDVVCTQSSSMSIILQAKFIYGPMNMAPLSGEMVRIHPFVLKGGEGGTGTHTMHNCVEL